MRRFCFKSVNFPLGVESVREGRLILPAIKESKLYKMEKNSEIKDSGERT